MDNKYKKLGKNSIFVFVGNIGSKAIQLLMLPFYTRWLSTEDYGKIDMIIAYSATLYEILTLCIASAIFIYPAGLEKSKQKEYFTSGIIFSVVPVICLAPIIYISFNFLQGENLFCNKYFYILILSILSFLQIYMQSFLRSIEKMKLFSYIGLIQACATTLFSFRLIPSFGLIGYIYALVLSNVVTLLFTFFSGSLYRYLGINSISYKSYNEMLHYSIPLLVNVGIAFLTQYLNRPLMEKFQSLENIGTFAVVNKFPSIVSTLIPIFCLAWQVSVIEEFEKKDYGTFYNKILKITTTILLLCIFFLIPLSKYLLAIFSSSQYHDSWIYMPLLSFSCIFSYWGFFAGCNFSAAKRSKLFVYSGSITAVLSIVLNYIFVKYFELWGVCISVVLVQIVFALSRFIFCRKYVRLSNIKEYLVMFSLYLISYFICLYYKNDIITFFVAFISVVAILYLNRKTLPQMISMMKSIIKK